MAWSQAGQSLACAQVRILLHMAATPAPVLASEMTWCTTDKARLLFFLVLIVATFAGDLAFVASFEAG